MACGRAGEEYSLTVRDTGPGIPAEAREKIFERFFRLDASRSKSSAAGAAVEPGAGTPGAGLGLAIARWIAEAHQGRLNLVQSDASGSVFTAYLPAKNAGGVASPATRSTGRAQVEASGGTGGGAEAAIAKGESTG